MEVLRSIELSKKTYDKLLNEVAKENDLTLNELRILMFLNTNEDNIAQNIVNELSYAKSQVSMSVQSLKQKGYIKIEKDENNKKKNHLKLTEKSFNIIKKGIVVQNKFKKIILNGISKQELNVLMNTIKIIKNNLEEYNK